MANYTTDLKNWGSLGTEFPDSYNYVEGEQPVDAWDNYLTSRTINDLFHLIDLTNDRLESDAGSSHPTSPEPGHFSYRSDAPVQGEDTLYYYDSTNNLWHRVMDADGDVMEGVLNMGGYHIEDTSGEVTLKGDVRANDASLEREWYSKQEGGTVSSGNFVPVGTFGLDDGETLIVTQSMLTKDGFTTPCVSGIDLVIADENDEADPANATPTVILSGDGTTLYDDETGSPLSTYENTSGGHMTVAIGLDNGHYNAGYGESISAFGGYIARIN